MIEEIIEKNNAVELTHNTDSNKYVFNNLPKIQGCEVDEIRNLSEEQFLTVFIRIGLINDLSNCPECGAPITRICYDKTAPYKRCAVSSCLRKKYYLLRNIIFSNKKVTFKKRFKLIEYFACRRTAGDCEQTININNTSIKEFYLLLRASVFKFLSHFSTPFDSQVVNIHVDETPITRRHGGIGRTFFSNTVWVISAVDIFNKKMRSTISSFSWQVSY